LEACQDRRVYVPELRLERAVSDDADALVELRDEAARWLLARGYRQWEVGEFSAEQFARSIQRDEVLVVRGGRRIVAAVTVTAEDELVWEGRARPDAAYVHRLIVARSHSGQGVGGAILAAVEDELWRRGMQVVRLDYVTSNYDLGMFYRRLGYREVGRREFAAHPDIRPCTLMEKQLTREATTHL
jgi:RimJ/RimL family protein N-acetyltransferase